VDPPGGAAIRRPGRPGRSACPARARAPAGRSIGTRGSSKQSSAGRDAQGAREGERPEAAARRRGALGPRGASLAELAGRRRGRKRVRRSLRRLDGGEPPRSWPRTPCARRAVREALADLPERERGSSSSASGSTSIRTRWRRSARSSS
jgi:hypothetical protein